MATKQKTIKWEPDNFELETNTVWSFPERGKWATHDAKWRGNWSPYIPRNIILRYSQEGDLILDFSMGSGTTMVAAKNLNRNAVGIELLSAYYKIACTRLGVEDNEKPYCKID